MTFLLTLVAFVGVVVLMAIGVIFHVSQSKAVVEDSRS